MPLLFDEQLAEALCDLLQDGFPRHRPTLPSIGARDDHRLAARLREELAIRRAKVHG